VWVRGEYQAVPAVDHGTLKCKMGFAPVFGAPDEIKTADKSKIQGVSVRPTRNADGRVHVRAGMSGDENAECSKGEPREGAISHVQRSEGSQHNTRKWPYACNSRQ
jgi:hypothetical protein